MPRVDPIAVKIDRTLGDWRVLAVVGLLLVVGPLPLLWLGWPWIKPVLSSQYGFSLVVMGLVLFVVIHICAAWILAERKVSAWIQDRQGPNRVGYWGILQPIADGIKFILKEDVVPGNVDKPIFVMAPAISFVIALTTFAVIPWAGWIQWPWTDAAGQAIVVNTQVAMLDVGVLYVLAISAMSVYGVVLGGWASNNKYAFYGGIRAAAQMISYEVPLGLGLLVILLTAGTLQLESIVAQQVSGWAVWNIFLHPIAFLLVLTATFAETNRSPFDLAECEQELIAGYHTEYSSMKLALFYLAEYAHMTIGSALVITLFLGGWAPLPFLPSLFYNADGTLLDSWWNLSWQAALLKFGIFWGKITIFVIFFMVIRWTIPRFRFDQLMRLAWKGMIPAGMALVFGCGVLVAFGLQRNLIACWVLNAVVLGVMLYAAARSPRPVTGRQDNLPEVEVVRK